VRSILIKVEGFALRGELNDSASGRRIGEALPLAGSVNLWGEEIYFDIPVALEQEADARAAVEIGELGYWPQGSAFCIFFGPTPASTDERPRAYSPVNVIGRLLDDPGRLKTVSQGAEIRISAGKA
jgi:hypothetical protein